MQRVKRKIVTCVILKERHMLEGSIEKIVMEDRKYNWKKFMKSILL